MKKTQYIVLSVSYQDIYSMPEEDSGESFTTLCHGEPWIGNAMFQYKPPNKPDEQRPGNSGEQATAAVFSGFHSCTVSKPGYDLAHFLMTSTTREFR